MTLITLPPAPPFLLAALERRPFAPLIDPSAPALLELCDALELEPRTMAERIAAAAALVYSPDYFDLGDPDYAAPLWLLVITVEAASFLALTGMTPAAVAKWAADPEAARAAAVVPGDGPDAGAPLGDYMPVGYPEVFARRCRFLELLFSPA